MHFFSRNDKIAEILTERKIDPSVIENPPIRSFQIFEALDEVREDRRLDLVPPGVLLLLQQVDGPQDRGPRCFVRCSATIEIRFEPKNWLVFVLSLTVISCYV